MILGISYYEYLLIVCFVSVCVGSFLNVVAYRLPKILMNDWRWQAEEFLGIEHGEVEKISLSYPRSACPKCGHNIKPWENVPVISYLILRAKCSSCKTPISARYPAVEMGTMILSVIAVLAWPNQEHNYLAMPFVWALVAIALIDFDHKLIPDCISLPLIWIGIVVAYFGYSISLEDSVKGAVIGFMLPWACNKLFEIIRRKQGMGDGDFKLLAAIGSWLGISYSINALLLGAVFGALVSVLLLIFGKKKFNSSLPFGPFIIIATLYSLFFFPLISI